MVLLDQLTDYRGWPDGVYIALTTI